MLWGGYAHREEALGEDVTETCVRVPLASSSLALSLGSLSRHETPLKTWAYVVPNLGGKDLHHRSVGR